MIAIEEETLVFRRDVKDLLGINNNTLLNFIKKGELKIDQKTKKIYMSSILSLKKELEERRSFSTTKWLVSHHAD
jgi:acyl CoA:acetate/3-ketoacid CoA transferase alpha subunit